MVRDNEQYAYFTVTGDFNPEAITTEVGLRPTEAWIKGSLNEKTHYERKFSRWSLDSRLPHSSPLEGHVRDVLAQLTDRTSQVRTISDRFTAWIQLVGWFYSDYPGFGLARETVADLARLNVSIDCDFYYLYSHEREDS